KKPPYICTPLTGKTKTEVLDQLRKVLPQKPDLIEWRADFLIDLANQALVLEIIREIKAETELPLLFTIRAEHEGGEKINLTEEDKIQLLENICVQTAVDLVDYETSHPEKFIKSLQEAAKINEKQLILSYHNFSKTPENEELIERAKQAASYGANLVKLAVMPESQYDVFRLLEVTREIDQMLDVPVVTMSMKELGALSRIIGWAYGSVITFGVGVELSAPGQMPT